MKKIGKNTKLYLIGMVIGGITLGITTVIADTIINSTSVAYKTTTVKAAIDELYGLADLKPRVDSLESYFKNSPSSYFDGSTLHLGALSPSWSAIYFYKNGSIQGQIHTATGSNARLVVRATDGDYDNLARLSLYGNPVSINERDVNELFKITCTEANRSVDNYGQVSIPFPNGSSPLSWYSSNNNVLIRQGWNIYRVFNVGGQTMSIVKNTTITVHYCYATPWQN